MQDKAHVTHIGPYVQPQREALQGEIENTFHHNKILSNRFTKDGGGTPEAFVFFEDASKQRVVGAVALYGSEIRTMIVCSAARRRGYGRMIVQYLAKYVSRSKSFTAGIFLPDIKSVALQVVKRSTTRSGCFHTTRA
jgi:GNAT superfamily N-acetyltransferase